MSDDRSKPEVGWPQGEPEPSAEERKMAAALADGLEQSDGVGEGEVGELLAAAEMIRASSSQKTLSADKKAALLDDVFSESDQRQKAQRSSWRRVAPALALAAALVLVIGALMGGLPLADRYAPAPAQGQPLKTLSRPSNDLLGKPIKDRAGAARRLDRVFADRLDGYRNLRLGRQR